MNRTVFKYTVPVFAGVSSSLALPKDAQIIKVDMKGALITLWVIVEPNNERVLRSFIVHGTGHAVHPKGVYVGTVFDGPFVWHLFELMG